MTGQGKPDTDRTDEIDTARWGAFGLWVTEECAEQPEEPDPLFKVQLAQNAVQVAAVHNRLCDEIDSLRAQLRDARAENERLRLNSDAATVAMTGQLYSDVESTAQQLHELGEQRAAKQIRMVLAQVRVAQRVASEFEQMVAELAAERAKVQRVEALCDERDAAELRQYPFSEAGGWVNTKRIRRALAGGEQVRTTISGTSTPPKEYYR